MFISNILHLFVIHVHCAKKRKKNLNLDNFISSNFINRYKTKHLHFEFHDHPLREKKCMSYSLRVHNEIRRLEIKEKKTTHITCNIAI